MRKISFAVPVIKTASSQASKTLIFLVASLEVNPDSLDLNIKDMDEQLAISLAVYEPQEGSLPEDVERKERNSIELDLLLSHFASMAGNIVSDGGYEKFANISYKAGEKPVWLIASSNKEFLDGVEGVATPFAGESTEDSLVTGMGLTDDILRVRDTANKDKLTFAASLMMLCPFYEIETLDIGGSKYAKIIAHLQNDFSKALDNALQELGENEGVNETNIAQLSDIFRGELLKNRKLQEYREAVIEGLGVKDDNISSSSVFAAPGVQ